MEGSMPCSGVTDNTMCVVCLLLFFYRDKDIVMSVVLLHGINDSTQKRTRVTLYMVQVNAVQDQCNVMHAMVLRARG